MKRLSVSVENSRLSRTFHAACKAARLTNSVPESKGNIYLFVTGLEKITSVTMDGIRKNYCYKTAPAGRISEEAMHNNSENLIVFCSISCQLEKFCLTSDDER